MLVPDLGRDVPVPPEGPPRPVGLVPPVPVDEVGPDVALLWGLPRPPGRLGVRPGQCPDGLLEDEVGGVDDGGAELGQQRVPLPPLLRLQGHGGEVLGAHGCEEGGGEGHPDEDPVEF